MDVAIIGAGVAGAYGAWRLCAARPGLSVGLFEAADRLGGRLYSELPPGMRRVPVEHGGMRFSRQHRLLAALVEHLGLPTRPFPSVLQGRNPIALRGRRTSLTALANGDVVPYDLPADLPSQNPSAIVPAGLVAFLRAQGLSLGQGRDLLEVLAAADFRGRAFASLSFLELLEQVCTAEMLAYYNDVHGYWVDTHNDVSARELLRGFLPFLGDADTLTLAAGMQSLPIELGNRAVAAGCRLERGWSLVRLRPHLAGGFELSFRVGTSTVVRRARRVILALPPNRIRAIEGVLAMAPSFGALMDQVVEIAAIKTHFLFERSWWRALGIQAGEGRTDLPLRQCLYMGSDAEIEGASGRGDGEAAAGAADEEPPGPSLLLASYTDSQATDVWRTLQGGGGPGAARTPGPVDPDLVCTDVHVETLLAQLEILHGRSLPAPIWASCCDWTLQPSGVATHAWRAGSDSQVLAPRLREIRPDLGLFLVGEAFSQEQGWVNGALRSIEALLQGSLGLPPPRWCPPDAPLDPLR